MLSPMILEDADVDDLAEPSESDAETEPLDTDTDTVNSGATAETDSAESDDELQHAPGTASTLHALALKQQLLALLPSPVGSHEASVKASSTMDLQQLPASVEPQNEREVEDNSESLKQQLLALLPSQCGPRRAQLSPATVATPNSANRRAARAQCLKAPTEPASGVPNRGPAHRQASEEPSTEPTPPMEAMEGSAQPPTEAPMEVPTELPMDAPTEVPTELPMEAPTEVPTELSTEAPTEVPMELPTEALKEVFSQQLTEAPTEVLTQPPTEEAATEAEPAALESGDVLDAVVPELVPSVPQQNSIANMHIRHVLAALESDAVVDVRFPKLFSAPEVQWDVRLGKFKCRSRQHPSTRKGRATAGGAASQPAGAPEAKSLSQPSQGQALELAAPPWRAQRKRFKRAAADGSASEAATAALPSRAHASQAGPTRHIKLRSARPMTQVTAASDASALTMPSNARAGRARNALSCFLGVIE